MNLRPQRNVNGDPIGWHIDQSNKVLGGNQAIENVVSARNTFDLQKIIRVRITPGESHIIPGKRCSRRGAYQLSHCSNATLGAWAGRLSKSRFAPGPPD